MSQADQTFQIVSESVEQTVAIASAVGKCAQAGDLIGLIGELGAGKTQFVRGLAQGLGIDALLDAADQALYRSKERGRNCVTHFRELSQV